MIGLIGIAAALLALYFVFKQRWGTSVLVIFAAAAVVVMIQDPEGTIFPIGRALWQAGLEAVGLR